MALEVKSLVSETTSFQVCQEMRDSRGCRLRVFGKQRGAVEDFACQSSELHFRYTSGGQVTGLEATLNSWIKGMETKTTTVTPPRAKEDTCARSIQQVEPLELLKLKKKGRGE